MWYWGDHTTVALEVSNNYVDHIFHGINIKEQFRAKREYHR